MDQVELQVIVFSRKRPMQLDACLRGMREIGGIAPEPPRCRVTVLARIDPPYRAAYEQVMRENPGVELAEDREFATQVRELVAGAEFVLFVVDDTLWTGDAHVSEVAKDLKKSVQILGYSLRLGRNTTECYMSKQTQGLPEGLRKCPKWPGFMHWGWTNAEHQGDWGYPLELSSSMYRGQELSRWMETFEFGNPNALEAGLYEFAKTPLPSFEMYVANTVICREQSVAFSAPVNRTQEAFTHNRAGTKPQYRPEELLALYLRGFRIDINKFRGFVPTAVHQEVDFTYQKTGPDLGNYPRPERPELQPVDTHGHDAILVLPISGRLHPNTADLVGRLCYRHGIPQQPLFGGKGVGKVRSQLASVVMGLDVNWQIWIDDDTIATDADVLRLLETAKANDCDVLAAVVPVRRGPARPNFVPMENEFRIGKGAGIQAAKSVGLALAVVHRRVFERMQPLAKPATFPDTLTGKVYRGFGYFLDQVDGESYFTEDYTWCKRVLESGSKIWVLGDLVAGHAGETILGLDDIKRGMIEINWGRPRSDLVILCPVYQNFERETEELIDDLRDRGIQVIVSRDQAGVDRVRSGMVNAALEDPAVQWIGWLDADHAADPDVFDRLIASAEREQADMMCAVYTDRQSHGCLNFRPHPDKWKDPDGGVPFGGQGVCIPVWYVAQGVSVTHRRVFQKLEALTEPAIYQVEGRIVKGRAYYIPRVVGGEHVGEDYAFADLCRKADVNAMVDTRICVGHVGRKVWTIADALQPAPTNETANDNSRPKRICTRCRGIGGWLNDDGDARHACPDCGGTGQVEEGGDQDGKRLHRNQEGKGQG